MRQRNVNHDFQEEEELPNSKFVSHMKKVDLFPKLEEDHTSQTKAGGAVSLVSGVIMVVLFLSELSAYLTVLTKEHIVVNTSRHHQLDVVFNLTFPALKCGVAQVDVMDTSGDQQLHIPGVFKVPIDEKGAWMDQPKAADHYDTSYDPASDPSAGCLIWGNIKVNKVAGNVHIALGRSHASHAKHVHQFTLSDAKVFNSSHVIHQFNFGVPFPGEINPLAGTAMSAPSGMAHYQYFCKVVPTTYTDRWGTKIVTNQLSVTEQSKVIDLYASSGPSKIPGVFFVYDISPFMVEITDESMAFTRFLISCCAIIGGVFAVAGVIDSVFNQVSKCMKRSF